MCFYILCYSDSAAICRIINTGTAVNLRKARDAWNSGENVVSVVKSWLGDVKKQWNAYEFQDLIDEATIIISSGKAEAPCKFLFIDECQDVSKTQMQVNEIVTIRTNS